MGGSEPDERPSPNPRRGRPPTLSASRIVDTVLELSSGTRIEDISMRALARELGAPVMTLYSYVASKEELQDLVADYVLAAVQVPSEGEGSWEERLKRLLADARRAVNRYNGVLPVPSKNLPEARRLADGVMAILADAGLGERQAALAFTALYTFVVGQIEVDAIALSTTGRVEPTLEGVTSMPAVTRDDAFAYGLSVVIEGIKALRSAPEG